MRSKSEFWKGGSSGANLRNFLTLVQIVWLQQQYNLIQQDILVLLVALYFDILINIKEWKNPVLGFSHFSPLWVYPVLLSNQGLTITSDIRFGTTIVSAVSLVGILTAVGDNDIIQSNRATVWTYSRELSGSGDGVTDLLIGHHTWYRWIYTYSLQTII